jgi:hypothetical protein
LLLFVRKRSRALPNYSYAHQVRFARRPSSLLIRLLPFSFVCRCPDSVEQRPLFSSSFYQLSVHRPANLVLYNSQEQKRISIFFFFFLASISIVLRISFTTGYVIEKKKKTTATHPPAGKKKKK